MSIAIKNANQNDFENIVVKSEKPVAVIFYSDDCSICLAVLPLFERMSEEYKNSMDFVKVDREINKDLAKKYDALASSSIIFFKDGQEICTRLYGYVRRPDLRDVINTILGNKCNEHPKHNLNCDTLVIGGGPAGLTAAIYSARAKLYTVVMDDSLPGGQVSSTYHIANYPGSNGVIRGVDLIDNMIKQAEGFGVQIEDMQDIQSIDLQNKTVTTTRFKYRAKSIILATGATPRKLNVEGEDTFKGRGVHYCATCDGALYQDADVVVVGGGNSAVEEALFLTRFAKHITVVQLLDHLTASKSSQDELMKNPRIDVIFESKVVSIGGQDFVTNVTVENVKTGEKSELKADGVFIYVGMQPQSDWFKEQVKTNEYGYVETDENMRTTLEGIFAAGDVRAKEICQISTAVGDGTIAGIMAEKYVVGHGDIPQQG